jgi:hypothetical protein
MTTISDSLEFDPIDVREMLSNHYEICAAIPEQMKLVHDELDNCISSSNEPQMNSRVMKVAAMLAGVKHQAYMAKCIASKLEGNLDTPGLEPILVFPKQKDWHVVLADPDNSRYFEVEQSAIPYRERLSDTVKVHGDDTEYEVVGYCRRMPEGFTYLRKETEDSDSSDALAECRKVINQLSESEKLEALRILKAFLDAKAA